MIMGQSELINDNENIHKDAAKEFLGASVSCAVSDRKKFFRGADVGGEPNNAVFHMNKEKIWELESFLRSGKEKKALELIKALSNEMKACEGSDIAYVRNAFCQLLFAMSSIAEARKVKAFVNNTEHYLLSISSNLYFHELEKTALEAAGLFFELVFGNMDDPIIKLMNYINEHYNEADLSIKRISHDLNFSDTYLCMLCKKNTGKTINNHITALRMQKACQLLKNTDMRLYKIGEQIGYADGKYFFRVFQKEFSMTPREYREKEDTV